MEGNPYGYGNFLFSFLDTPEDNYPQVTDSNSFITTITLINSIPVVGPEIIHKIWSRALSKRLGFLDQDLTWT